MTWHQFQILYRQFLFRMVDIELLSTGALGDVSKLLGQFASLLIFLSLGLAFLGFGIGATNLKPPAQLVAAWTGEHFLISTTMLVVGLFAILSWDSIFPDKRDVLVLSPLPVRPLTVFLSKVTALATALGLTVVALHFIPALVWPFALNQERPAMAAPAITYDPALPSPDLVELQTALDRELAHSSRIRPGGVAIGISKHGVRRVFAYGTAKPNSILQIGSISKTFTGLLLAQMVVDGRVALDEPVRQLLPPGVVPRPSGAEITLLDLATHRSGLPAMPDNIDLDQRPNPLAGYRTVDLYTFLAKQGVAKPTRMPFDYSNVGGGLLGTALANSAGITYEELLQQEIAGPLGMHDTTSLPGTIERDRILPARYAGNDTALPLDLGPLAGAGAICSTAGDMLDYLEAQLHPHGPLTQALILSHTLRDDVGQGTRISLFWMYNTASGAYWHNGAVGGYTSYAFFDPRHDTAAIVLFNMTNVFGFADVLGEHIRARLAGEPAISLDEAIEPASGGLLNLIRRFVAYWITMLVAGAFTFTCILTVQGVAALVMPRQLFLRISSFLQLALLAVFIAIYFLEPTIVTPALTAAPQSYRYVEWSPTYWFLGLCQQLNGSPALSPLAHRAWLAIAIVLGTAAFTYSLAYLRTLRRIIESPDIASRVRGWLPAFGNSFDTAVGQFSLRTVMRSRQHRLIVAFYLGIGFAAAILFPRWPPMRDLSEASASPVSLPVLGSTVLFTGLCVLGARIAFSLPVDLRANWIFRIAPIPPAPDCMRARRHALYALALIPVWTAAAVLSFSLWPWQIAAKHCLVLALLAVVFGEAGLIGIQKLPFTCSYLPGRSNFNMTFLLCTGAVLTTITKAVQFERATFEDPRSYLAMVCVLAAIGGSLFLRNAVFSRSPEGTLHFEDAGDKVIEGLGLNKDGVSLTTS